MAFFHPLSGSHVLGGSCCHILGVKHSIILPSRPVGVYFLPAPLPDDSFPFPLLIAFGSSFSKKRFFVIVIAQGCRIGCQSFSGHYCTFATFACTLQFASEEHSELSHWLPHELPPTSFRFSHGPEQFLLFSCSGRCWMSLKSYSCWPYEQHVSLSVPESYSFSSCTAQIERAPALG